MSKPNTALRYRTEHPWEFVSCSSNLALIEDKRDEVESDLKVDTKITTKRYRCKFTRSITFEYRLWKRTK